MNIDGEFFNIVEPISLTIGKSKKFRNGKVKFLSK